MSLCRWRVVYLSLRVAYKKIAADSNKLMPPTSCSREISVRAKSNQDVTRALRL
jgi:hypothetical protein